MRRIKLLFLIAVVCMMMLNCKKDDDGNINKPVDAEPEPTQVGTVIADAGSGIVGPEGGSLITDDGKLELIFPGGALNSPIDVSIQLVTNNAPGGKGNAFRFGPAGTALNSPVTLKLHYTDEDVYGSLPMFLGMAVQDTNQIWYKLGTPAIDTINKTISVTSKKIFPPASALSEKGIKASNFLDHATFLDLYILPESAELKISESVLFTVYAVENHNVSEEGNSDEDFLPPLPVRHEVSASTVKQWTLNGSRNPGAEFGTITPNGASCRYTAPGEKPSINPVNLTADLKLWYKDPKTGQDFNNLKITAPITIVEDQHSYQLEIYFYDDKWPAYFTWTLTDKATMDVIVTNGIVSIKNIRNSAGTVEPTTQTKVSIPGVLTCTSNLQDQPQSTGYLNISGGTGQVTFNDLDPNSPWLSLSIQSTGAITPRFSYECTNEETSYMGGETLAPQQLSMRFVLTNEIQNTDNIPGAVSATLTPKTMLP